jgi:thiamine biosynthesis lipoprotein
LTRCLASLVCFGLACAAAPVAAQTVSDGRLVMGTVLEISLVAANSTRARAELDARFAQAAELEAILSRFSVFSDVSRLTNAAGGAPLAIDPRTRELLDLASEYAQASGGVFDVTVGPLVELWSAAARRGELPSDA